MDRITGLLLALAAALFGQVSPEGERLARAREMLMERDKRLPDYTCVQTVERRFFKRLLTHYTNPTCDQARALSRQDLLLETTDRLRLDVKVSQGVEIGSWPGSQFSARSIFDLIGGGPFGTGMLGPLIADIFGNGGATYRYTGDEIATGTELFAYRYEVPLGSSHYRVK